jgi:hypothetical protein
MFTGIAGPSALTNCRLACDARAGAEPFPLIQIKPVAGDLTTVGAGPGPTGDSSLTDQLHAMTPHHLPFYIAKPGETDVLMIVTGIFLVLMILAFGNIYLRLHSLPERLAHKSQKIQFEIVAVLGLISLFTHMHIFWIAGLLLALIDLPDFSSPLTRIAGSVEKIADTGDGPPKETSTLAESDSAPVQPVK